MSKAIAVAQSTSGDMPDTGLDVLNQEGDSIEVTLARLGEATLCNKQSMLIGYVRLSKAEGSNTVLSPIIA